MADDVRADAAAPAVGAWRRISRLARAIAPHLHAFRPRLVDDLAGYDRRRFGADVGAGITVGIVALPLAMAFAIASGVKPEQGIFTAIIAGFLISALGGSSVQIGGPAGAFIVIVYGIVQRYGVANLLIATVLAGVLLLALGWLKLGALVRYIPVSIVVGFTNGIAVLIAVSQLKDLLGLKIDKVPADFFAQAHAIASHLGDFNLAAFGLGVVCFAGLVLWARLAALPARSMSSGMAWHQRAVLSSERTRRVVQLATRIPGPIVALVSLSLVAALFALPVETIGTRFGGIPRALPAFVWPDLEWESVQRLFVPTVTIALLGAVESLLCARVADGMATTQRRHDPDQELMAQGIANIVTPFFGGIPATGTIARTVTNLRAGATSPIAGMVHAATLLGIVLVAAPLASHVPLAVLAGVLLFVAWNMGEWHAFRRMSAFSFEQRVKLFSTFLLTVLVDLTVAMEVGLAVACIVFVYRMGALFRVEPDAAHAASAPGVVAYRLYGSLFFAAVAKLEALPEQLPAGTTTLALDAHQLVSIDASGLDAFENLHRALARAGIRLVIVGLNEQPLAAMRKWGLDALIGPENLFVDRDTAFAALVDAKPQQ
ncbi:MAG TPA: SulP family inorganic anion transporter [Caldimonas sp.]|jgi:SulP family sulfate permease|nr:SulP family inorganic anion transporter [Caldimonas sp.]HEV7575891.1 SulP family inorganic anion transporter [Caldimonas sp.]